MLRVLHINQSDSIGGASIAGYRLHQGLINLGVDSRILAGTCNRSSNVVNSLKSNDLPQAVLKRLLIPLGLNNLHATNTWGIVNHPFFDRADIVNCHNLHGNYFNYLAIPKLAKYKPIVFRLPDMWTFTGHCSYSYSCNRWETGCGKCPFPETYPAISYDNTSLEWKLKEWVYNHSNLTIITPSQWLADKAKLSLLNRFPIHHIPNGLDTNIYRPISSELCRDVLGVSNSKKVIAFAAQSLKDTRKGGDLLITALQKIPTSLKENLTLVTLGDGGEELESVVDIPTISLGYTGGDRLKAIVYSAADLFVFPTRADNLPLVLQETMACGTPVVSFHVGGVPELVRHGITGLLAEPENSDDLAIKITETLENESLRQKMAQECRAVAENEYNIELQAQRYISLYKDTITNFKGINQA